MEPGVVVALVGAAGAVGAGLTGTVVAHVLGRQTRAAQQRLAEAQAKQAEAAAEQLQAEEDRIRQSIYQDLTRDLRTELQQVKAALHDARQSLAATSAEAERLRQRVVELESRIAQLGGEVRSVQAERDQLRIQLAGKEATITALTGQIGDLKAQLAALQPGTTSAKH
ncbi:hypothetical protein AB0873_15060 [Micromonospora sp. NPDC047707]|uniref:hypothetical protein n=1 Tax=Micromonospora sp. NPDC047707 TaxID=3154498 RepID=UPI003452BDA5